MKIFPPQKRSCRKGPAAWFTGTVWIDEVIASSAPSRMKANRVSFEPGARTAWHTHPMGQALHVVSGVCLLQLKGEPAQTLQPGDSAWIEAGELHWHGASPSHTMVHLAIQEPDEKGVDVVWLEHVSEEEYGSQPS